MEMIESSADLMMAVSMSLRILLSIFPATAYEIYETSLPVIHVFNEDPKVIAPTITSILKQPGVYFNKGIERCMQVIIN